MGKKVDQNRLKGNYAEHLVSVWLSEKCLVRPVVAGTDIGIDLYCEAIIDDQPYKHFWVQVKAIGESKLFEENGNTMAKFPFKTNDLKYWAQQPIPVYVFLVPVPKWPPVEPTRIFCIRITEQIIRDGIPKKDSIMLSTKECFERESLSNDLEIFIHQIIPWDSSIILLEKGIIAPIREDKDSGNCEYPKGVGKKYFEKMMKRIYDSAIWTGVENIDTWNENDERKRINLTLISKIIYSIHEKNFHQLGLKYLFAYAKISDQQNLALKFREQAHRILDDSEGLDQEKKNNMHRDINDLFTKIMNTDNLSNDDL